MVSKSLVLLSCFSWQVLFDLKKLSSGDRDDDDSLPPPDCKVSVRALLKRCLYKDLCWVRDPLIDRARNAAEANTEAVFDGVGWGIRFRVGFVSDTHLAGL